MANTRVICRNFVGRYARANALPQIRDISRGQILKALITVGFQRFRHLLILGWRQVYFRFGTAISLISYLEIRNGNLCVSGDYGLLDPSEMRIATYWFGMAFAKLVAESELGITWLAHVKAMVDRNIIQVRFRNRRRPDLIGQDLDGDWHTVEAKGRHSFNIDDKVISSAKRQADSVAIIDSQPPATTFACFTALRAEPILVCLDDPPRKPVGEGDEWEITDSGFFGYYYSDLIAYIKLFKPKVEEIEGNDFVVAPVFPKGCPEVLNIGLLIDVFNNPSEARIAVKSKSIRSITDKKTFVLGQDGIALLGYLPRGE